MRGKRNAFFIQVEPAGFQAYQFQERAFTGVGSNHFHPGVRYHQLLHIQRHWYRQNGFRAGALTALRQRAAPLCVERIQLLVIHLTGINARWLWWTDDFRLQPVQSNTVDLYTARQQRHHLYPDGQGAHLQ